MNKASLSVEITFTENLLATSSGNPELHAEYQAARVAEFKADRSPEENKTLAAEEMETLSAPEAIEKASTVFHRDEKGLFLFDYTWRGHIKETIGHLCELGEFKNLSKWTYKRACDGCVFVGPRRIYLFRDNAILKVPEGTLQRPLRATTMQGDRVALARSEKVDAGAKCYFTVSVLESSNPKSAWREIKVDLIRSVLDMGSFKGTGQWRGGGNGTFEWHVITREKVDQMNGLASVAQALAK